jgi:hypothetical protein
MRDKRGVLMYLVGSSGELKLPCRHDWKFNKDGVWIGEVKDPETLEKYIWVEVKCKKCGKESREYYSMDYREDRQGKLTFANIRR